MFDPRDKSQQDERIMTRNETEKKNEKLSSNDISEDKNENTETVANVTQPRISTEGL